MGEILEFLKMAKNGTPYISDVEPGDILKNLERAKKGIPYIPIVKSEMEVDDGTRRTKKDRRHKK